jgi:hypothetical protein
MFVVHLNIIYHGGNIFNTNSEEYYRMESHRRISKGRPKNIRKGEVLNGLKKLRVKNWTRFVKDRKFWYGIMQKAKTQKGL